MARTPPAETTTDVELRQGRIAYRDAGTGAPLVFVHGFLANSLLWREVIAELGADFRCIAPDWPLGSHRFPMRPGADLSPTGLAEIVVRFMDAIDLERATLVGNDTGGAVVQLVATKYPERVDRLVLTNCDAFDNFPPRLFAYLRWAAFVPGGFGALAQSMRLNRVRTLPIAYGWLMKEPDPDLLESWVRPGIGDPGVRRDASKVIRDVTPRYTLQAARDLASFDKPVLLAWARDDKFFPAEHARRLADILPNARLEWIEDSRAFVPQDQPVRLANLVREFMAE
jgi:pimeloyl-ACP methyl ester carboxylesterase